MKSMNIAVYMDAYGPRVIKEKLMEKLADLGVEMHVKDLREEGGDYIIIIPTAEFRIERKTSDDLFISLSRNVYEHGEPKKEGIETVIYAVAETERREKSSDSGYRRRTTE